MHLLEVNHSSSGSIVESFDSIAKELFTNYKLVVNENEYRFIDLEFYYYDEKVFKDVYAHKHPTQLQSGKWYFHGSGVDITIGNGINLGGILIRAIAKISTKGDIDNYYIEDQIHGSLNVVTEIGSSFNDVFQNKPNSFGLHDIEIDRMGALMKEPPHIIKTKRIGLNADKDETEGELFYNGKFRYVILPHLKLRDKMQIAHDMHEQYPELSVDQINKTLGSKFL
jgi:hypothetical protein